MIVYNTTYVMAVETEERWVEWTKKVLIPAMLDEDLLFDPKLYKVLSKETDGVSYCLQCSANSPSEMNRWQKDRKGIVENLVTKEFGENVLPFSTFLKRIV